MGHDTADHDRAGLEPPASMDELRGDCARMARRWEAPAEPAPRTGAPRIRGVRVPPGSVALVAGMSDYGD